MTCQELIGVKGTRFFIGDKSLDESGITYTEVGMIESLGEFGPDAAVGAFIPMNTGVAGKYLGATDNGELSLTLAKTSTDDGLKALLVAQKSREPVAYKLLLAGENEVAYGFNGLGRVARLSIGSANDVVKITCAIALSGAIWYDDTAYTLAIELYTVNGLFLVTENNILIGVSA